jgi:hypothetical protein
MESRQLFRQRRREALHGEAAAAAQGGLPLRQQLQAPEASAGCCTSLLLQGHTISVSRKMLPPLGPTEATRSSSPRVIVWL